MKKIALAAALVAGFATGAAADGHGGWGGGGYGYGKTTTTYAPSAKIVVSCYRGPYRNKVKWDKPNPVFIKSLVAAGYSHSRAKSIAWSVCRNPAYINNLGSANLSGGGHYSGGGGHNHATHSGY